MSRLAAIVPLMMTVATVGAAAEPLSWLEGDDLAAACANLGPEERRKFREAGELLDLQPVCLPRGEWLHTDGKGVPLTHFGWPVAVRHGGVIHVVYPRGFTHSRPTEGDTAAARTAVARSTDDGRTWKRLEAAGLPAQIPTVPTWGAGPDLLLHPREGLVSLGATSDHKLLVRTSKEQGQTWRERVIQFDEPIQEPSGLVYDGRLILMPRTGAATGIPQPGARGYHQYWSDPDWTTFQKQQTTILAGEWRFDGTLLRTEGREHDRGNALKLERDGMCPGGSVIAEDLGVQLIYVYMGHFQGPTGIFQVTRTLDTDRLRRYLLGATP